MVAAMPKYRSSGSVVSAQGRIVEKKAETGIRLSQPTFLALRQCIHPDTSALVPYPDDNISHRALFSNESNFQVTSTAAGCSWFVFADPYTIGNTYTDTAFNGVVPILHPQQAAYALRYRAMRPIACRVIVTNTDAPTAQKGMIAVVPIKAYTSEAVAGDLNSYAKCRQRDGNKAVPAASTFEVNIFPRNGRGLEFESPAAQRAAATTWGAFFSSPANTTTAVFDVTIKYVFEGIPLDSGVPTIQASTADDFERIIPLWSDTSKFPLISNVQMSNSVQSSSIQI
jgi:hypothetical protein